MAKSLGDFLHDLFKKAGQNPDDPMIKDFLSNTAMTLEVSDLLAKRLDNNLLSVADAKNNHPEVKWHYYKAALDGVDTVVNEAIADLPDDVKAEIAGQESSYKKLSVSLAKIKELEAKKSNSGKGDKDALQKQIDDLHKDLAAEKKRLVEADKQYKDKLLQYRVDSKKENLVSKYKTTLDDLDPDVRLATINSLLNKELQDKDAVLTFDEKDSFTLLKKDGSNYYGENHQQVNPASFVEQLLSRNKLLITTPKPGEKPPANPTQPASGGGGKDAVNTTLKSLASEARKSFEKNGAVVN